LEELRAVGDRVTILRDGETVHSAPLSEMATDEIIRFMVGREVTTIYERTPQPPGEEVLRVEKLTRRPAFEEVCFTLRAGEIVGLAGLIGAGRTELCRALFGLDAVDSGSVRIAGREARVRSPREAVGEGIALIPEDRQKNGLAVLLPIGHNLTHANLHAVSPFGFLNHRADKRASADLIRRLRVRAESPRQLAGRLSGGNQQKVVIGKWLFRKARVFLFDEPTRGIDVGAKIEVFQLMDELARSGAAILMVSSEMSELLQVADRILVMRRGRMTAELPGGATQEQIMRHAVLHDGGAPPPEELQ
jgi:ABC-type sugar transport system ATPase subunit